MLPRDRRGTWRCPRACLYVAMFSKCRHQSESNEQSPGPLSLSLSLFLFRYLSPSFCLSLVLFLSRLLSPSRNLSHVSASWDWSPLGSIHNWFLASYKFPSRLIIDLLYVERRDSKTNCRRRRSNTEIWREIRFHPKSLSLANSWILTEMVPGKKSNSTSCVLKYLVDTTLYIFHSYD